MTSIRKLTPWQLPSYGLGPATEAKFWSLISKQVGTDDDAEHWIWTGGTNSGYPSFMVGGKGVTASRITWALVNGGIVPRRLARGCREVMCVKPDHFSGTVPSEVDVAACRDCGTPLLEPSADWSNVPDEHRCEQCEKIRLGILPKPPSWDPHLHERYSPKAESAGAPATIEELISPLKTLDALAGLQFGKEPAHHPIRRVDVSRSIQAAERTVVVAVPKGTVKHEPTTRERARYQAVNLDDFLAVVFAPQTMVVTFPSGTVMITSPSGRVVAPDPEAAVQAMLRHSGKRRVVG